MKRKRTKQEREERKLKTKEEKDTTKSTGAKASGFAGDLQSSNKLVTNNSAGRTGHRRTP